jgi:conjugal transfer pilus assembly protein TraE
MNIKFFKSKLAKLIEQRNGFMVLALGLMVLCLIFILLVFRLVGRERIIISPPVVNKSFWVTNSEVSVEYLSEMTIFFAYMRLNVTPENVDYQHEALLRFVDSSYYGTFKGQLVAQRDHLVDEHINTAFYPAQVKVDAKKLRVLISGNIHSSISDEKFAPRYVTYEIVYTYNQGRLLIKLFNKIYENTEK